MQHASNCHPPGWLTFLFWVSAFSGGVATTLSDAAPSHPRDVVQTVSNPLTGIGHDGEADDGYGYSIAVAGNTALIGVPWDDMETGENQGSVHVMTKIGDEWQVQAKLVAPELSQYALFGSSVAIDGDLVLVGANSAPNDAGVRTGAAYVFQREGEQWHFVQRLIPQNAIANDLFGWKVAINGHTALVSSTKHLDTTSGRIGKVAVFQFDGTTWSESAPWLSDATSNVSFGTALALQDDMALVGSPGNERVDVYELSGGVWQKTRTVVAPDNDPLMTVDGFGEALAVDGATAVIGAPDTSKIGEATTGRAFQYDISQDWAVVRVLSSSIVDASRFAQSLAINGEQILSLSAGFTPDTGYLHLKAIQTGQSVVELPLSYGVYESMPIAIGTDEVLVGMRQATVGPNGRQGMVARFTEDPANIWSPTDSLNSGNGGHSEGFGHSVAISGDTAVVGMNNGDYGDIAFVATAHVFERGEQGWVYRSRLVPPDPQRGSLISSYVDIDGDTILLSGDNSQTQSDVCHVFVREDSQWVLQQTIPCAGSDPKSRALSGDRLVIGARFRADPSGQEGAVDVYRRVAGVWSLETTLRPDNCPESCGFGSAVDIHGDKILVGAVSQGSQNSTHYGAAYLYELGPQGWGMTARWTLPTVGYFATEVALGEHVAAIASRTPPESGVGASTGMVHVFGDHAGSWQFESEFMGDTSSAGDNFGSALAVDGNGLLVGAYSANNLRGTAYLFERSASGWQQSMQFQPAASLPGTPIVFGYAVAMSGSDVLIGIPDYSEPVPWGNALEGAVQFIDSALEYIYSDGFE